MFTQSWNCLVAYHLEQILSLSNTWLCIQGSGLFSLLAIPLWNRGHQHFPNGPCIKYLGCADQTISATTTFCSHREKADQDNTSVNKCGCVLLKLYIWILKFEFLLIFTLWDILLFLASFFVNHLKMQKSLWGHRLCTYSRFACWLCFAEHCCKLDKLNQRAPTARRPPGSHLDAISAPAGGSSPTLQADTCAACPVL